MMAMFVIEAAKKSNNMAYIKLFAPTSIECLSHRLQYIPSQ